MNPLSTMTLFWYGCLFSRIQLITDGAHKAKSTNCSKTCSISHKTLTSHQSVLIQNVQAFESKDGLGSNVNQLAFDLSKNYSSPGMQKPSKSFFVCSSSTPGIRVGQSKDPTTIFRRCSGIITRDYVQLEYMLNLNLHMMAFLKPQWRPKMGWAINPCWRGLWPLTCYYHGPMLSLQAMNFCESTWGYFQSHLACRPHSLAHRQGEIENSLR